MSDEKFLTWNRKMDNLERKEANCSQFRFDSNSPLDTSSLSITKEEMSLATETISLSSELAQVRPIRIAGNKHKFVTCFANKRMYFHFTGQTECIYH